MWSEYASGLVVILHAASRPYASLLPIVGVSYTDFGLRATRKKVLHGILGYLVGEGFLTLLDK